MVRQGQPSDDPDLLKGIAGVLAIRDYFDVCPDYADNQRGVWRSLRRWLPE